MARVVVTGAGGFIGGHLVADLRRTGATDIVAVDLKPIDQWYQRFDDVKNVSADLSGLEACRAALEGAHDVYNLAADMGGMGFIEANKALCMLSVLINTHLLQAARDHGVKRYFFASSACVYAEEHQRTTELADGLKESDAYPAMPEDGYGWEKLFSERMCRHFQEDFGIQVRVGRYHNVYGPHGTYAGGREKAPAAICRKVATAVLNGSDEIEIWGDGKQTRSFTYIDDCIHGTRALMDSDFSDPINIGSDEMVSIDGLADIVEEIADVKLRRDYNLAAPKGVRGRNSDNTLIKQVLGWAPDTSLHDGLAQTYRWIHEQLVAASTPEAAAALA